MMVNTDAIRARAEAAQPGPWYSGTQTPKGGEPTPMVWPLTILATQADAEFVAHAREDVPALCDALDAAREEIARLRAALEVLRGARGVPTEETDGEDA